MDIIILQGCDLFIVVLVKLNLITGILLNSLLSLTSGSPRPCSQGRSPADRARADRERPPAGWGQEGPRGFAARDQPGNALEEDQAPRDQRELRRLAQPLTGVNHG